MPRAGLIALMGRKPEPVGGPVYTDDFNRPDADTPGDPWIRYASATFQIRSNKLTTPAPVMTRMMSYGVALPTDHYASAEVTASASWTGKAPRLLVRFADESNYIIGGFEPSQGEWQIWERVNGSTTKVATAPYNNDFPVFGGDRLRVETIGNLVRVLQNETVRVTYTSSHNVGPDRQAGIRTFTDNAVFFDNWECGGL